MLANMNVYLILHIFNAIKKKIYTLRQISNSSTAIDPNDPT